ncbi:bifunctional mRNA-decapping enzyme subunit 1/SAC3-GANP-THP3 [Babesia duncani]|uniref:Bifunctional mRNA-decapping enzyme subunit 1/SAC3-GANP-THP3 n=1 Tax=Babesia duncani TaxID=323732 RepID=A0AAD9UP02_9APIC|nr:bifunctional mRNA-decapping enzyme subunit 1/SAC3-GANP-THP3 [Babesia duncani]
MGDVTVPDFLSQFGGILGSSDDNVVENPLLRPLDGSMIGDSLLRFQEYSAFLCNDTSRGFVGTLHAMCSSKECSQKIQMNTANDLERDSTNQVNDRLCLKSFQRSDASRIFKPEEVRPAIWCRRTVYNILCHFVDVDIVKKPYLLNKSFSYLDVYNFLRDRLRSIWQDLTVQHCTKTRAYIESFEISIRFLIYSNEILFDNEEYDIAQNLGLLNTCLDKLMDGYLDVHAAISRNDIEAQAANRGEQWKHVAECLLYKSPHEAEFWSYRLLLLVPQLLIHEGSIFCDVLKKIPQGLKSDPLILFGRRACLAAASGNCFRYFSMMRNPAHPLHGALLNRFSSCVRIVFLSQLVDYNMVLPNRNQMSVDTFAKLMGFDGESQNLMESFYSIYGLATGEDNMMDLVNVNLEKLAKDKLALQRVANKIRCQSQIVQGMLLKLNSRQTLFDPEFQYPSWYKKGECSNATLTIKEPNPLLPPTESAPVQSFFNFSVPSNFTFGPPSVGATTEQTSTSLTPAPAFVQAAETNMDSVTAPISIPPLNLPTPPPMPADLVPREIMETKQEPIVVQKQEPDPRDFQRQYIDKLLCEQEAKFVMLDAVLKSYNQRRDNMQIVVSKPEYKQMQESFAHTNSAMAGDINNIQGYAENVLKQLLESDSCGRDKHEKASKCCDTLPPITYIRRNLIKRTQFLSPSASICTSQIHNLTLSGCLRLLHNMYKDNIKESNGSPVVPPRYTCRYCKRSSSIAGAAIRCIKNVMSGMTGVISSAMRLGRKRVSENKFEAAAKRAKIAQETFSLKQYNAMLQKVMDGATSGATFARSFLGDVYSCSRGLMNQVANKYHRMYELGASPLHRLLKVSVEEANSILFSTQELLLRHTQLEAVDNPRVWADSISWHLHFCDYPNQSRGFLFEDIECSTELIQSADTDYTLLLRQDILLMLDLKISLEDLAQGSCGYKKIMAQYCADDLVFESDHERLKIPATVCISINVRKDTHDDDFFFLSECIANDYYDPRNEEDNSARLYASGAETMFHVRVRNLASNIKDITRENVRFNNVPNLLVYTCSAPFYIGYENLMYVNLHSDGNLLTPPLTLEMPGLDAYNIIKALYGNVGIGAITHESPMISQIFIICYRISVSELDLLVLYELLHMDPMYDLAPCDCKQHSRSFCESVISSAIENVENALRKSLLDRISGPNVQDAINSHIVFACVGFQQFVNETEALPNEGYLPRLLYTIGLANAIERAGRLLAQTDRMRILQKPFEMPSLQQNLMQLLQSQLTRIDNPTLRVPEMLSKLLELLIKQVTLQFPSYIWDCGSVWDSNGSTGFLQKVAMGKNRYSKSSFVTMLVELKNAISKIHYRVIESSTESDVGLEMVALHVQEIFSKVCNNIWVPYVTRLRNEMSMKLLKALDEDIEKVLHQVPFVTAYIMGDNEAWERAEIEGFLYLVYRRRSPRFSFILINRKSEFHLVESLNEDIELSQDGRFIFYRITENVRVHAIFNVQGVTGKMKGLWFKTEQECNETFDVLTSLVINCKQDPSSSSCSHKDTPRPQLQYGVTDACIENINQFPKSVQLNRLLYLLNPSLVEQQKVEKEHGRCKHHLLYPVTITFEDLDRAISKVMHSKDFAAMVWEQLSHKG